MILEAGGNPFITYVPILRRAPSRGSLPIPRGPVAPSRGRHRESAQNTKSATGVIFVMGGVAS